MRSRLDRQQLEESKTQRSEERTALKELQAKYDALYEKHFNSLLAHKEEMFPLKLENSHLKERVGALEREVAECKCNIATRHD